MSEGNSFGIALGRKLRTLSAKDLPLTPRAVLRAMADRADADGVLYPALETIAQDAGTYPPTVRRALDWLDLAGWFEVLEKATARKSARYRLRLEPAPRTGKPAERSPWRDRETTTIPQGDDGSLPGCSQESPRETMAVSQGDDSDRPGRRLSSPKLTGSSQEAHKEAPIAHAREHTRGDRPAQMGIPFGPSDKAKAAERPQTPEKPARKGPDGDKPPKAGGRYLAAFVAGLADAGHTITPPRTSDGALLGRICGTHAKSMGVAIRGDDLLTWIRGEAKAFRQAITRPEVHRGGISVFGLQTWLDNGRPVQPPSFRAAEEDADDEPMIDLENGPIPPPHRIPRHPPPLTPQQQYDLDIREGRRKPPPELSEEDRGVVMAAQARLEARRAAMREQEATHG